MFLMKKKVAILLVVLGIILLGIFGLRSLKSKSETVSPAGPLSQETSPTSAPLESKTLTWKDQAGFIFNYPEGIKINDHPEDNTNYSHLDLTAAEKNGGILIMASDTGYKSAAEWGTKDRRNSQIGGGGTAINLGGKPGRKISFPDDKTTIVGTVDEGILFTIKLTPEESGYWEKTFDQIVSSFEFWQPTPAESSAPASDGGGDVIEEEEIIE